jgi:hypothetical protein
LASRIYWRLLWSRIVPRYYMAPHQGCKSPFESNKENGGYCEWRFWTKNGDVSQVTHSLLSSSKRRQWGNLHSAPGTLSLQPNHRNYTIHDQIQKQAKEIQHQTPKNGNTGGKLVAVICVSYERSRILQDNSTLQQLLDHHFDSSAAIALRVVVVTQGLHCAFRSRAHVTCPESSRASLNSMAKLLYDSRGIQFVVDTIPPLLNFQHKKAENSIILCGC